MIFCRTFSLRCSKAARKGQAKIVDVLVQAGASLSGLDGGIAALAVKTAALNGDKVSLDIWAAAGVHRDET